MTALTPPPRHALSLWNTLRARLSALQQRSALWHEMDSLDANDLRAVLHDLNISKDALPIMVDRSGQSPVLLPAMLDRVGLDGQALEDRLPAVANDLRRVCAGCTVKTHCRHALADGASAVRCMVFCPNAHTLDALRREQREAA